mmetsp:Transcript_15111/g.31076  ORF Transcript_15111/g.31076 Transcript_15111/m.31076 type:complete len:267 (+) Transcript_15111:1383-2183(+)
MWIWSRVCRVKAPPPFCPAAASWALTQFAKERSLGCGVPDRAPPPPLLLLLPPPPPVECDEVWGKGKVEEEEWAVVNVVSAVAAVAAAAGCCARVRVYPAPKWRFRKAGLPVQCTLPATITATVSATASASSIKCVVNNMVRPEPRATSFRSRAHTWCLPRGSIALVGSSRTTNLESPISAMPMDTRRRCPPDSSPTNMFAGSRLLDDDDDEEEGGLTSFLSPLPPPSAVSSAGDDDGDCSSKPMSTSMLCTACFCFSGSTPFRAA